MDEMGNKTVETTKKQRPKWLLPVIGVAAVAVIAAVVVLIVSLTGRSDDEWLRKALAEDSVRTIELNEDIVSSAGEYEVNGTKTIVGNGKILMDQGGGFGFSVNKGASLTVDGITVDLHKTVDNGVVVRSGGELIWKNGVLTNPKQYDIMSYGSVLIENGQIQNAGAGWVYVKAGTTTEVRGGTYTKTNSAGFEVEAGAELIISGTDTLMRRAGTNTINNNGTLTMTGGTIADCETWTITNHGVCSMSNVTVQDCVLKGVLYNYADAVATIDHCTFKNSKTYHVYNVSTVDIRDTYMEASGGSSVNNQKDATMNLENVTISHSGYHGVYNDRGTINMKNCTIDTTVYKGVQNKNGQVTIDGLVMKNVGGSGLGNVAVVTGGDYGFIHANNVEASNTAQYNVVSYGGEVVLTNSVFNVTDGTNIYLRAGTGVLENVKILGTKTEGKAALALGSDSYRTINTTIRGNTVITGSASRGITNYGTLTMYGGQIYGNANSGSQKAGAGVYTLGTFYMYGGSITGNSATTYGGGVRVDGDDRSSGRMYMYGGTVADNHANANGGGISVAQTGCALYMYGGTVSGNTASGKGDGILNNGVFELYDGAIIRNNDVYLWDASRSITVKDSSLSGEAVTVRHGALVDGAVIATFPSESAAAALSSHFVSGNSQFAFEVSGAKLIAKITTSDLEANVNFDDAPVETVTTFQQLKRAVESTTDKKVIKIAADITLSDVINVPERTAVKLIDDGTGRVLTRSGSYLEELFIVNGHADFYMQGSTGLTIDGGGVAAQAPMIRPINESTVVLQKGATLRNATNTSGLGGKQGAAVNVYGGRMILAGGFITGCNNAGTNDEGVTYNYGAIYVSTSAVLSIQDGCISGCQNGAVRSYGRVYMSGGLIENNYRGTSGGASADGGAAIRAPFIIMTGGTIRGNVSTNAGGAIYLTPSEAYPEGYFRMTGGTLSGNCSGQSGATSTTGGGAVYVAPNCTFDCSGGTITGNHAGSSTQLMNGGAIYNAGVTVISGNVTISGNYSNKNAGAIMNANASLTISGATITGNYSNANYRGGFLYSEGSSTASKNNANVTISNSIIDNNTAGGGGAIVNAYGALTISNTQIRGNTATRTGTADGYGNGGAILNMKGATLTLSDVSFSGNKAVALGGSGGCGGAVYNDLGTMVTTNVTGSANESRVAKDLFISANTTRYTANGKLNVEEIYLEGSTSIVIGTNFSAASPILLDLPYGTDTNRYKDGEKLLGGNVSAAVAGYFTMGSDHTEVSLGADGRLSIVEAKMNGQYYASLADALAAAQGDTVSIELLKNVNAALNVAAGKTLNLSGAFTVTGSATVAGTLNLTDTVVRGNVALQGTLGLSGKSAVTDGEVAFGAAAAIHVTGTLANTNVATISGVTMNQTVLTGETDDVAANAGRFVLNTAEALKLSDAGVVVAVTTVAMIGTTPYSSMVAAMAAANDGDTINVIDVVNAPVSVDKNVTFTLDTAGRLNGKMIVAAGKTMTLSGTMQTGAVELGSNAVLALRSGARTGSVTLGQNATIDFDAVPSEKISVTVSDAKALSQAGTVIATGTKAAGGMLVIVDAAENTDSYMAYPNSEDKIVLIPSCEARIGSTNYATLEDALAMAQAGDTVVLMSDIVIDNVTIDKNLTLMTDGNADRTITITSTTNHGIFFNGPGSARNDITAVLRGTADSKLIIKGTDTAKSSKYAVCLQRAQTTMDYVVMRDANSSGNGAGIYVTQGDLTMNDCLITKNTSAANGGGLYSTGTGTITLNRCEVSENQAKNGGAIYAPTSAVVTLNDCTFTGNRATGTGGALQVAQSSPNFGLIEATNCTFTGNTATGKGGALEATGKYNLTNCTFIGNSGTGADIDTANTTYPRTITGCFFDKARADAVLINTSVSETNNTYLTGRTDGSDTMLSTLSAFDGTLLGRVDGLDTQEAVYLTDGGETYATYAAKLVAAGYTADATKVIDGNTYGTYTNETYTVTLMDTPALNGGTVRVVIERKGALPATTAEAPVNNVEPLVTMLGVGQADTDENGMSFLFRLSNGKFVVFDGGYGYDAQQIYDTMYEQAGTADVTIAAWVITHAHGDHSAAFVEFWGSNAYKSHVTLEKVVYNFASDAVTNEDTTQTGATGGQSPAARNSAEQTIEAMPASVERIIAHPGQVLYLNDATIEVLYTAEMVAPSDVWNFNDTSVICKVTLGGESFMMLGDCAITSGNVLTTAYSAALKSDVLQVAHHGYYNNIVDVSLYQAINPSVALWPSSAARFSPDDATGVKNLAATANKWLLEQRDADAMRIYNSADQILTFKFGTTGIELSVKPDVATVGTENYKSLYAACQAAGEGDTVTLLANVTETAFTLDKNLTLSGAYTVNGVSVTDGKVLTLAGGAAVSNVTLEGSAKLSLSAVPTNTVNISVATVVVGTEPVTGTAAVAALSMVNIANEGYMLYPNSADTALAIVIPFEAKIGTQTYATLSSAIEAAQDGDTVVVTSDVETANLTIGKNLTVQTDGYTDRTLRLTTTTTKGLYLGVAADSVTVNLTGTADSRLILEGNGDGLGGGERSSSYLVCVERAQSTMDYVVITKGLSSKQGAGLYVTNGSAVLNHSEVSYNFTNSTSGGGGMYLTASATVTLNDCAVTGNQNTNGPGGAIQVAQSGGTTAGKLIANTTTFTGNIASAKGGVLRCNGAFAFDDCDFVGNVSTDGIISVGNSTAVEAFTPRSVTNCRFSNDEAGALTNSGDTATMSGCEFSVVTP